MLLCLTDRNVILFQPARFRDWGHDPPFSAHPGTRCLIISWSPNIFPIILFSSHPPSIIITMSLELPPLNTEILTLTRCVVCLYRIGIVDLDCT
jgi:hypothetical protein